MSGIYWFPESDSVRIRIVSVKNVGLIKKQKNTLKQEILMDGTLK